MSDRNRVTILDTTLRDGELTSGVQMTIQDKIAIARVLEAIADISLINTAEKLVAEVTQKV